MSGPSGTLTPAISRVCAASRLMEAFAGITASCLFPTISSFIGALLCFALVLNQASLIAPRPAGRPLAAVAHTLVGDVTNVVRIDTLRSAPLVVDGLGRANPSLDRALGLRPGLIAASPAKLPPHVELAARYRSWAWCPGRFVAKRPLISAYGTRLASPAKLPSDFNACAARMKPVHAASASAPPTLMRRTPSAAISSTRRPMS